jgi:hypothetical protein
VIEAGEGKEDRLMHGSYLALRAEEAKRRERVQADWLPSSGDYLPEFLRGDELKK